MRTFMRQFIMHNAKSIIIGRISPISPISLIRHIDNLRFGVYGI